MRRALVGTAFVLHGLAHAGAGMWAAGMGPAWVVSILWGVAMVGFVAAGFGLLGVPLLRRRWERIAVAAAVSSIMLLGLFGSVPLLLGLAVDVGVLALGLQWGESAAAAPKRPARHRLLARAGHAAAWAFLVYLAALVALRPWHMRWGTTAEERMIALPGDGLVPEARYRMDHAVTIHAPAAEVWMWLVQIGQARAGFYSYDRLERMAGARIRNVDRIVPEWQRREVGELVRAVPADWMGGRFGRELGWRVAEVEPERALVLRGWGAFVLRPLDERTTRLHIRLRGEGTPSVAGAVAAPLGLLVFEPAHFIMERGMLLGIKRRAEETGY